MSAQTHWVAPVQTLSSPDFRSADTSLWVQNHPKIQRVQTLSGGNAPRWVVHRAFPLQKSADTFALKECRHFHQGISRVQTLSRTTDTIYGKDGRRTAVNGTIITARTTPALYLISLLSSFVIGGYVVVVSSLF